MVGQAIRMGNISVGNILMGNILGLQSVQANLRQEKLHLLGKLRSNLLRLATIQGLEKETTWKML